MPTAIEDRIAVSTWSLHRLLGTTYPQSHPDRPSARSRETYGPGDGISLLDLPSALANHGYRRMELVSFHLPSRDPVYLDELRDQLAVTEVTLQTLLIDRRRHHRSGQWRARHRLDRRMGRDRQCAGRRKCPHHRRQAEAIEGNARTRSVAALSSLARSQCRLARAAGDRELVRPSPLCRTGQLCARQARRAASACSAIFGNWKGAHKYAELARSSAAPSSAMPRPASSTATSTAKDYGKLRHAGRKGRLCGPLHADLRQRDSGRMGRARDRAQLHHRDGERALGQRRDAWRRPAVASAAVSRSPNICLPPSGTSTSGRPVHMRHELRLVAPFQRRRLAGIMRAVGATFKVDPPFAPALDNDVKRRCYCHVRPAKTPRHKAITSARVEQPPLLLTHSLLCRCGYPAPGPYQNVGYLTDP